MTTTSEKALEVLPVDPGLLERANWWFDVSWYGLLWAGAATAIGAVATVTFLFVQYWSSGVRERQTDWRTSNLESVTVKAKADLGTANADIAKANAEIADAKRQAAALEKETADAKERTASLEREAEQARLEQERLKQIVSWRALSQLSGETMVNVLKQSKALIKLGYVGADPEALRLAIQFSKVLEAAQWKMFPEAMPFHPNSLVSG